LLPAIGGRLEAGAGFAKEELAEARPGLGRAGPDGLTGRRGKGCIRGRMKALLIPAMALGLAAFIPAPVAADDTPLAEQMDLLNDAYKAMRRTDDAAEGAELARAAQQAMVKAFAMTPDFVAKGLHPETQEKAMASYRTQTAELLVILCRIEAAFVAGDLDAVKELITPLRESKKKGHDEFMED
jgi:soluble cytochrome b562